MQLPDRQFKKAPHLVKSLRDIAQLPMTPPPDIAQLPMTPPPDIAQLPTRPIYPDITQLPTTPWPPDISIENILFVTPPGSQDESSDALPLLAHQSKWSSLLLYSKIVLLFVSNLTLPFLLYVLLDDYGFNITPLLYSIVVILLLVNAYITGLQTLAGLRLVKAPVRLATLYPPASAIIAAHLPDDATTIVETVKSVLCVNYPGPFQVILAYNTPYTLPVESILQKIAAHDRRLVLLRIEHSTSRVENINCAIREVTGTFVGIFDADHHPAPDSFKQAWQWLAHEYQVVQGRRVVRNGDHSWIARLVAVEFEMFYALEYPGHRKMYDFGLFAGSNGYWRTDLLRKIGINSFLFAEGIDASMRVLQQGYRIIHDPLLICSELAPETLNDFWRQHVHQAQGWFQVTLEHFWTNLSSPSLSFRQKLGSWKLLVWREIYAWLPLQMLPILAFQVARGACLQFVPLFVLSSTFMLGIFLLQVWLAYRVAIPEIRRHFGWFVSYAVFSLLFFTELKNLIIRIAQLKELSGEQI